MICCCRKEYGNIAYEASNTRDYNEELDLKGNNHCFEKQYEY